MSKKKLPDTRDKDLLPSRDSRQHYVYKRDNTQLIRFSDYHPKNSSEAFFYQLLLRKVPFRDEVQLISESNTCRSYLLECQLRPDPDRPGFHILHDEDDLNEFVQDYCERHMYRYVRASAVCGPDDGRTCKKESRTDLNARMWSLRDDQLGQIMEVLGS